MLLVAASIAQIAVVFKVTTANTTRYGADRLEVISGELEKTINATKLSTLEFAIEVQPLISERDACEAFIREKKTKMMKATDSVCFNVYLATDGWYYIPDFKSTDDYIIEKSSWYISTQKLSGEPM